MHFKRIEDNEPELMMVAYEELITIALEKNDNLLAYKYAEAAELIEPGALIVRKILRMK